MGVEGDSTPTGSRVGPGSALITAQARGDPRVCVARPRSQAALINQAAALCYSSSLPRLASDTPVNCKTRSAEPPPHLEFEADFGPKAPWLVPGGECLRACARVCV